MAVPLTLSRGGACATRTSWPDVEDVEIRLILEAVHQVCGFDFRDYALPSLRRRIWSCVHSEGLETVSALQDRVLHDTSSLQRFVCALTVNVSSMFRDVDFFRAVRQRVVPLLREHGVFRIWHAGCATGEEVYSMAILLEEEGVRDQAVIYATDLNEVALTRARNGILPLCEARDYERAYLESGGRGRLADYYTPCGEHAVLSSRLRRNLVWGQHNLATDASFNDFHLILCRNVLIYFTPPLQARVHRLLHDSLVPGGMLALGRLESLRFSTWEGCYETLDPNEKIFRKVT